MVVTECEANRRLRASSNTCRLPASVPTHTCVSPTTLTHSTVACVNATHCVASAHDSGSGTGIRSTFPVTASMLAKEKPGPPYARYFPEFPAGLGLSPMALSTEEVGEKVGGRSEDGSGRLTAPLTFIEMAIQPKWASSSFAMFRANPFVAWLVAWELE